LPSLREAEIVGGLSFIIGEDRTVVALNRRPHEEAVERGQHEVGGLPVLLAAAAERHVVRRAAIRIEGKERAREDIPPIVLNRGEQRAVVQPFQLLEEV
jgi:hypothetical protein